MNSTSRQIAKKRIQILFRQAKKAHSINPQLSSRYIASARRIAMAARLRLPVNYRRQICKNCNALLVQGENCRVRIKQKREPHIVITCLDCGYRTRILLRKKKEQNRSEQDNYPNETSC